jgi:hypothetical protein
MRPVLRAPALALVLVLVGCVAPSPGPDQGTRPSVDAWALDCTLGAVEGGNWSQPCVARASHTAGPKQEIWLAVNPKDPANVVLGSKDLNPESSNHCVWNGLAVTHDAGKSWKDVTIGGKYAARQPGSPFFGYACNTDPMMAFDKDGLLHYVVEVYNLGGQNGAGPLGPDPTSGRALLLPGWDLVLATSRDGGDTWPDIVSLLKGDGALVINDYSRITVSPKTGSIVTAIGSFRGVGAFQRLPVDDSKTAYNECSTIASRDKGKTADTPVVVTGLPNDATLGCRVIAAAPDGTIVLGAGGSQTWWTTSKDDGKTFAAYAPGFKYKPIPDPFTESKYRTGTNFEAAYDLTDGERKGTLYCVYADASRDEADIYVRASKDNGKSWGEPVRVNDDEAGPHQFIPNIVVASDGTIHVFFMDKRHDPAHKLIDITHAVSADGGATWTNERVTAVSFDGDLGRHQEGFPFIGDYIGIGAVGDDVWAGFPDATTGTTVIAAAHAHRASP